MKLTKSTTHQSHWAIECIQEPLLLFNRTRATSSVWTRTKHVPAVVRNSLAPVVSGVEPVNGAASEHRTEYPPRWSRVSRWMRGRAGWCCELCGTKNRHPPNRLTVHHLDGNKWNLMPWNLAALCQRCHREVQWTLDFCQSNLTGVYPEWLRAHVKAYNVWAQGKGRTRLTLTE